MVFEAEFLAAGATITLIPTLSYCLITIPATGQVEKLLNQKF